MLDLGLRAVCEDVVIYGLTADKHGSLTLNCFSEQPKRVFPGAPERFGDRCAVYAIQTLGVHDVEQTHPRFPSYSAIASETQ